jgi:hypothetical protein
MFLLQFAPLLCILAVGPVVAVKPLMRRESEQEHEVEIIGYQEHDRVKEFSDHQVWLSIYEQIRARFDKGTPLFIMALGPTGSGKSGLEDELIAKEKTAGRLQTGHASEPHMFLIDEYVEKAIEYKDAIHPYLLSQFKDTPAVQAYLTGGDGSSDEIVKAAKNAINHWASSANDEVFATFSTAYFGARGDGKKKGNGCGLGANGGGCKKKFGDDLQTAVTASQDIIYESTGQKVTDKMAMLKKMGGTNYKIIGAMNVVHLDCQTEAAGSVPGCYGLIQRNSGRAADAILPFLLHKDTKNAPRLPNLDTLKATVLTILDTAVESIDCVGNGAQACTEQYDEFHVYDNNVPFGQPPLLKATITKTDQTKKETAKAVIDENRPTGAASAHQHSHAHTAKIEREAVWAERLDRHASSSNASPNLGSGIATSSGSKNVSNAAATVSTRSS